LRNGDVFHIHGLYDPKDPIHSLGSLIITERDYRLAYDQDQHLTNFLFQLFQFHTVVFIGFSLNDDFLISVFKKSRLELENRQNFESIHRIGNRREIKHFILAHSEDGNISTESTREMGLMPILYEGDRIRHPALQRLLEEIRFRTTGLSVKKPKIDRMLFEDRING
jgi:hypothetical protein